MLKDLENNVHDDIQTLLDKISNAIIFNEKLQIVCNDSINPYEFHPYYLLSSDIKSQFKVKGYRQCPKEVIRINIGLIKNCQSLSESFIVDDFPEFDRTSEEIDNGFIVYANIFG